jgi:protein-L-isoaspartate(D-aspartate) O-methyltransferase
MDYALARRTMTENQLRTYDVTDHAVLSAFETVPRENFVPAEQQALAYGDHAIVVAAEGVSRTMLPPMVLARMLQAAAVKAGDAALVVAGGSGYSAAILCQMGLSVTLVEDNESMAALARTALLSSGHDVKVFIAAFDNSAIVPAPLDLIMIEGAIESEPSALLALLGEGGRLIAVKDNGPAGRVVIYRKTGSGISQRSAFNAAAPVIPSFRRTPQFVF